MILPKFIQKFNFCVQSCLTGHSNLMGLFLKNMSTWVTSSMIILLKLRKMHQSWNPLKVKLKFSVQESFSHHQKRRYLFDFFPPHAWLLISYVYNRSVCLWILLCLSQRQLLFSNSVNREKLEKCLFQICENILFYREDFCLFWGPTHWHFYFFN